MSEPNSPNPSRLIAAVSLATIASVFPGLASGALAVQASADFDVSEGTYGWALGSFFIGAAVTSLPLGRLAQRLGPRRQLLIGLTATVAIQLTIALLVSSFGQMLAMLALAGVANSGVQSAVNLALTQASLPRLGLAIATKQAAMPGSAMIGGLAVPVVALTLGWRWSYVVGAAMAAAAITQVRSFVMPAISTPVTTTPEVRAVSAGQSPTPALYGATVVVFLFAFTSGAINAWTVSSGVDAGLSEGVAGVVISAAAGTGIAVRLLIGSRIDASHTPPFRAAALLYIVGIAGFALAAVRLPALHVAASILAFGGGWIWPVATNYAIVTANRRNAAAATGLTQTGVYVGVFSAPIVTGRIIDSAGYPTMWLVVASVGVIAAIGAVILSPQFPRPTLR